MLIQNNQKIRRNTVHFMFNTEKYEKTLYILKVLIIFQTVIQKNTKKYCTF